MIILAGFIIWEKSDFNSLNFYGNFYSQQSNKGLTMNLWKYLSTSELEDIQVILKGDTIAGMIDLAVVRMNGLFVNDKCAKQLLYYPDSWEHKPGMCYDNQEQSIGKWAAWPFVNIENKEFSPLGKFIKNNQVDFNQEKKSLHLQKVDCEGADLDWSIQADKAMIMFEVAASKAQGVGIEMNLYPLYTHANGIDLNYIDGTTVEDESIILTDSTNQMPKLEISNESGKVTISTFAYQVHGNELENEKGANVKASGLNVRMFTSDQSGKFSIKALMNSNNCANNKAMIANVSKSFKVDAARKMGDALISMQQQMSEKYPSLKNLIPAQYDLATHEPVVKNSKAYVVATYMPRTTMSFTAASLATSERKYVDAALASLKSFLSHCPQGEQDEIFVIGTFDCDGKIMDVQYDQTGKFLGCYYDRPSNYAIMIRALNSCFDVYRLIGDHKTADIVLDYAVRVLKGLKNSFGIKWEYVNNPHLALAELVLRLEMVEHKATSWAKDCVMEDLAARGYDKPLQPLRIAESGAEESNPNTEQDYASLASEAMATWILDNTQREDCRKRVLDLNRIMTLTQRFYPDSLQLYGASIVEDIGRYVGGYENVMCHGGMWDLVRMEMLLAGAKYFNDDFSREAADLLAVGRLNWAMKDNGSICGMLQNCPGVEYQNRNWAETLNYGVLGLWLMDSFYKK